MKLFITTVLSSLAFSVAAQGYVVSSDSQAVRDSSGQCVRTNFWTPADKKPPCDPSPPASTVVVNAISADVLFGFDQVTLTAVGATALKQVGAEIANGTAVVIIGHADPIGDADYNQLLSGDRAAVVADFLANMVSADFEPQGVGSTEPPAGLVARCDQVTSWQDKVSCYAPARRVEIIYTAK
jgi:OOP family OmpA-OmpF porin